MDLLDKYMAACRLELIICQTNIVFKYTDYHIAITKKIDERLNQIYNEINCRSFNLIMRGLDVRSLVDIDHEIFELNNTPDVIRLKGVYEAITGMRLPDSMDRLMTPYNELLKINRLCVAKLNELNKPALEDALKKMMSPCW